MSLLRKSNKRTSSRRQVAIKGVRDNILLLTGNNYRTVLQVSSVNFELKSEEEQDALIETYQSFLNSLVSPLQMTIRVREMNMDKYLDEFRLRIQDEPEEIYKQQMQNYIEFIQSLITTNKILARQFYVVIPYSSDGKQDFTVVQEQLKLSADIVAKGLSKLGIRSRQLTSLEILDLFYSFYSPESAKRQPLTDQTMQLLKEAFI